MTAVSEGLAPSLPVEVARSYRRSGLWGELTLAQAFHDSALAHPDRDAVVALDGRLTYAELDRHSDRVAAGLVDLGLRPGDPMLLQLTNRAHTVVAWYGALKAGVVPVATLASHRAHELGAIGAKTGAVAHLVEVAEGERHDLLGLARQVQPTTGVRHLITAGPVDRGVPRVETLGEGIGDGSARRVVEAVQAGLDPDGVAVFQLSGGTTGVPKVIPRRHAEYWYNARAYAEHFGWDPTTRVAHLIPVVHNAGIVCAVHAAHSVGATLLLGPPDGDVSVSLLAAEGVTDLIIGHALFQSIAEAGVPVLAGTLRRAVLSGTKIPERLFDHVESHGVWAGQLFGMSEGFFALSELTATRDQRLHTVGTPLSPDDRYVILEPGTERPVPEGETGELCCCGPYTIAGYYDAPDANAASFTSDGFYRTGDLASVQVVDGEPCISIDGRIKDLINRGGEKVNAEEVELLLLRHPDVAEAAVVAMPDDRLGERACAFVVADAPLDLGQVREHLAGLGVATWKWPERLVPVDQLPRSNIGKVDKKALREEAAALPQLPG